MKSPLIQISNVPILEQNFSWSYTCGAQPFSTTILTDNEQTKLLKALVNPVDIKIVVYGAVGNANLTETTYEIKNCWLLEPMPINDWQTSWRIADNRYRYINRIVTCSYNKTRAKNSVISAVPNNLGTPSELRQDFDTFREGRYIEWSIKGGEVPYTIQEILEIELAKLGIPVLQLPFDNESYYIENIEINAQDAPSALDYICGMGRYDISINNNGEVFAYNIDYFDKNKLDLLVSSTENRKLGAGKLYLQDKKRMRPQDITIFFEEKEEIWLTNSSSEVEEGAGVSIPINKPLPVLPKPPIWDDLDIELNKKVVGVENVIQIPYPITIDGKEYLVGEWVPMWRYLKVIGLTEQEVRDYWFSNALETIYVENQHLLNPPRDVNNEAVWRGRIAAIRKHYRQVFRIDPLFMDTIESWDTRRVGIVDNYSRYSPPSPLFSNYTVLVKTRQPKVAKRTAGWDNENYIYDINLKDPARTQPTAGTITMVNKALGIFAISYPPTHFSALFDIIPFELSVAVKRGVGQGFLATQDFLLNSTKIKKSYEMQTIISIVRGPARILGGDDVYDERRYYPVTFENTGGEAPEKFHFNRSEYARFSVKKIGADPETGQLTVVNDASEPVNINIINALARSEASRIMHNYDDFPFGNISIAGILDMRVQANIANISISMNKAGVQSSVSFKPVASFTLEQKSKQEIINFLHRHISRADDRNLPTGGGL